MGRGADVWTGRNKVGVKDEQKNNNCESCRKECSNWCNRYIIFMEVNGRLYMRPDQIRQNLGLVTQTGQTTCDNPTDF